MYRARTETNLLLIKGDSCLYTSSIPKFAGVKTQYCDR
jgi:hypothetical protein